jgi:hypothetical protein
MLVQARVAVDLTAAVRVRRVQSLNFEFEGTAFSCDSDQRSKPVCLSIGYNSAHFRIVNFHRRGHAPD